MLINKLKNKFFSLLGLVLLATLLVTLIHVRYTSKSQQNSFLTISATTKNQEHFQDHVDVLMTNTWQNLEENAGISLNKCNNYLLAIKKEYRNNRKKAQISKAKKDRSINPQTKALIQEIFVDFGIDPRTITIVSYDGKGSPASTDDYTIYVDEQDLAKYSPEAQRFVIAHEISHIKNKDHSCETAIRGLMDGQDHAHTQCLNSFAHSIEFRADINAMIKDDTYAKGGIAFFHELINRYGDDDCATHPQSSKRLKIAEDIHAMHREQGQSASILRA